MTTNPSSSVISVKSLNKIYDNGFQALKDIDLEIQGGEIFALLGPNGAGKTTLIGSICGITRVTSGKVDIAGFDNVSQYRQARSKIGLVPQELTTDAFEKVWDTVTFSRGLFGLKKDPDHIEKVLKSLSLWDKKDSKLLSLSGGMKRRVMIAKALAHEPRILFLDEPTAGVDVELRKSMWNQVHDLRQSGVTVILTTHYIEEAEEMADRIGVINKGRLILTEKKSDLMAKLGQKELVLDLDSPLNEIPSNLHGFDLRLASEGNQLIYMYHAQSKNNGVLQLLDALKSKNLNYKDLSTRQSSLEEIFVQLVNHND